MAKRLDLVTAEEFVRIWQSAKNYAEVIQKTGLSAGSINWRAWSYRQHGVELKWFRKKINWDALKDVAKETLPKKPKTDTTTGK